MLLELEDLQNGTDIRGIAIDYLGKPVKLTSQASQLIACGFVRWLENKIGLEPNKMKIGIGMDSRLSGPLLRDSIVNVLINLGCEVYDCGLCTTPAMFMTTVLDNYKYDGAIMITASHLPYYFNGLKFFTKDGGCEKEDIKNIIAIASTDNFSYAKSQGNIFQVNFIEEYSNLMIDIIKKGVASKENYDKPLLNFKIIVDAGNGSGGFFANRVLKILGADTTGSQFIEPDGKFPNHIPNPEDNEAMDSIKNAVLRNHADLGIIFDTDVDRAAVVDSNGMEINKNSLIALISSIILEETPKSTIVTDSVTSTGLSEFINNLGGVHHRFKRGYKNVINEAKRLNIEGKECKLAIETSGHAALKENYFLDDGAYLITKILIKMAKLRLENRSIGSLVKNLKIPCESLEFRFNIKRNDFKEYGLNVITNLEKYIQGIEGWKIEPENHEGIRASCDKFNGNGWFLLRMSLHEPVLALNVESDSVGGTKSVIDKLILFLYKYSDVDINSFNYSLSNN